MGYLLIIAILGGIIIGLVIYIREKPRELQKEIDRLRRSIASEGLSFEQVEYKIENLKKEISDKRESLKTERILKKDMDSYFKELEDKIDEISNKLFLKKQKAK